MFKKPSRYRGFKTIGLYLLVIAGTLSLSTLRLRAQSGAVETTTSNTTSTTTTKPYFSLSTNRTYGTADRARVWINYSGIDQMDFRVYRVADPVKFFTNLEDPHKMGEGEKTQIIAGLNKEPSALEKVRSFKVSVFKSITDYFRNQLRRGTRESLNQKFNREGDRQPLNVADYARVPLLNQSQLVTSWREKLTPLDNEYDTRMVMLGKRDPGVYLVEAVNGDLRAYTIAIVTDLTMINKTSPSGEMLIYTADRKTGAPRDGVKIEVIKLKKTVAKGATDKSGQLRTRVEKPRIEPDKNSEDVDPEEGPARDENSSYLVTAQDHDSFAISDLAAYYFGVYSSGEEDEGESEGGGGLTGYVYTDRPIYRPDQKVFFRGILRTAGERGYELPSGSVKTTIEDPNGGKVLDTELKLTPRGAFSGSVDIAAGAPLGQYRILAKAGGATASEYFEVQEYKKPEYKVTVTTPKKFVEVGQKTKFMIEARYFFGEPVKQADVQYYIYRSRYYPWWWADEDDADSTDSESEGGYGYGNDMVKDGEGVLNANGKLEVEFEVPTPDEKDSYDYTYRLEAQVTDEARRTIEAKTSFIGTRGSVVASTRTDRYVYYQGDSAKIKLNTTDYEGHPVAAGVTLKFVERRWDPTPKEDASGKTRYEYTLRERELASADVTTNQQGEASYDYAIAGPGSVTIKTIVKDGKKQYPSTEQYLWVADKKGEWSDWSYGDDQSIKLVPDKKSYQPGETAHVLAMLPTEKAHLLVTTELTSVLTTRIVDSPTRAVMIDVPIEPRFSPNVYLNVAYIQDGEMYTHDRLLNVPAKSKFLNIEVLADKKEYKPRETAKYTILARNSDGSAAAGAELSLGVVDEAIYSVKPDQTRDIRKAFYGRRYNQVQTNFTISYYFKGHSGEKPLNIASNKRAYQLADFKNEGQYAEPTIRKDFKDTTFWQPDIVTGADGKASVEVKLPDNLTTWRATVRGVTTDTKVGSAILKFISRKNLILRLETPRFLTEGDTVTLSAIVHNYLDAPKAVKIAIDVTGARLLDTATQTVNIPKQGEHRIDWRVAANQVGQVKLVATAQAGPADESDGVEIPLEVVPHGLKQTTGGAVTLAGDSEEKTIALNLPAEAHAQARTLRIEASPSVAGTLFGALDYLTAYPYGCTEQTMSSFLPNVIVAQALKDVKTTSIRGTNDLSTKVQRGMDRLYGFQHGDGGWGWWKDDKTDAFMTAYVIDGLTSAVRAGYAVERSRITNGRQKLMQMLGSGKSDDGATIDPDTRAYMIYALGQSGTLDGSIINDLFAKRNELQGYGRALLALALKQHRDDNRARQVAGEIEQAARTNEYDAHWESTHTSHGYKDENNTEATALSLKALTKINPQSGLLSKAARWLVGTRRNGYYWESTRQTAFAIFGLIDYVKVSKELSPDYSVQVYLNGEQVISKQVTAADVTSAQAFVIERKGAQLSGSNQVRVVKSGKGALYLSSALSYFTRDDDIKAQSTPNLTLTREYLRLRVVENGEQARWEIQPLSGEIRSGDLIVSRLHVKGSSAQYMMIEDPIPAGCEQIERISGLDLSYVESGSRRWSDWYSTREFRDQKTAIFLDYFGGDATYQVALRVQVPGEFRVAPARVELMYQPTVQANTASAKMSFLDKK